jgi:release factor glutamine methyltransferase
MPKTQMPKTLPSPLALPSRTAAGMIASAAERLSGLPNPELDAEMLFLGVSGLNRAALLSGRPDRVATSVASAFEVAVARRERHEPIQYILGTAAFWRDDFLVNEAVLIPRTDTEILVEAIADRLRTEAEPRILDLGTGSGCIALSLLRELPRARALAVDLSEAALRLAVQNSKHLTLDARIEFRVSTWFSAIQSTERFAAVVSNPPYVARIDEPSLPKEVRDFEPGLALFADQGDDISSYRAILRGIGTRLDPGGLLGFEVGIGQADRVASLLAEGGFASIEVLPDLSGIPRVILGRAP